MPTEHRGVYFCVKRMHRTALPLKLKSPLKKLFLSVLFLFYNQGGLFKIQPITLFLNIHCQNRRLTAEIIMKSLVSYNRILWACPVLATKWVNFPENLISAFTMLTCIPASNNIEISQLWCALLTVVNWFLGSHSAKAACLKHLLIATLWSKYIVN